LAVAQPPAIAAESDLHLPFGNTQRLMRSRVIMDIVIDPSAPASSPTIQRKQILEDSRRVSIPRKQNGMPIGDQRPAGMIGDDALSTKPQGVGLAFDDNVGNIGPCNAPPSRESFRDAFEFFR